MGKLLIHQVENLHPQSLQRLGVGIQGRHFLGQRGQLQFLLEPERKIVSAQGRPQSRLEHVQIEAGDGHPLQSVTEFGESGGPVFRGDREPHRAHEVEIFSLGDFAVQGIPGRVLFDGFDQGGPEVGQGVETDRVHSRQPFPDPLVAEHVVGPIGEIVGRLGGEELVLEKVTVCVLVDDGIRGGAQDVRHFLKGGGALAGQGRQRQA